MRYRTYDTDGEDQDIDPNDSLSNPSTSFLDSDTERFKEGQDAVSAMNGLNVDIQIEASDGEHLVLGKKTTSTAYRMSRMIFHLWGSSLVMQSFLTNTPLLTLLNIRNTQSVQTGRHGRMW